MISFWAVWKQSTGQSQVAGFWVWQLVLMVGCIFWGGFPGDFLPVIQKGESKPLGGGFQRECTVKLSINMR